MKPAHLFSLVASLALSSILALTAWAHDPAQSVPLFNGRDLSGWVIENNGQFSVADGVIKLNRGTGWLRSEKTYADFALHIEFRFLEAKANSGIFVRTGPTSHKDDKGYPDNGYQVQCMDIADGDHPIATLILYGAPPYEATSRLEAIKQAYRPAGEWQTYTIICLGESMKIYLNRVLVTSATNIKNLEGHIGLQGELGPLEFRKIELTKL